MIITTLLFNKQTFRKKQLAALGFPNGDGFSYHASTKINTLKNTVPDYLPKVFLLRFDEVGIFLWMIPSLSLAWFIFSYTGSLLVAFALNWILWEVWALFNLKLLSQYMQYNTSRIQGELEKIVKDEEADKALCAQLKTKVESFCDSLATSNPEPRVSDVVTTPDGDTKWDVSSVHFHGAGNHPSDRDATIVVKKDGYTKVCVVPSFSTIEKWLDDQLAKTSKLTSLHTHTHNYLSSISVSRLLSYYTAPRQTIIDTLGALDAQSGNNKKPLKVSIYGKAESQGQILLQSIALEGTGVVTHTDVQPVLTIRDKLKMHLAAQSDHPVLIEAA